MRRPKSGEIKGYFIRYREFGTKSDFKVKKTTQSDGRRAVLSGLKYYTQYEIILRAYSKAGPGPNSNIHVERTNEGGKASVINLYIMVMMVMKKVLVHNW